MCLADPQKKIILRYRKVKYLCVLNQMLYVLEEKNNL